MCETCLDAIHPIEGGLCSICGERLISPHAFRGEHGEVRCGLCRRMEPSFVRAVAYGSYEGGLRDLVHMLKYQQVRPAANVLGRMLAEVVESLEPSFEASVLVIPVPLHRTRFRQRGFNQSELIARLALKLTPTRDRYLLCGDGLERMRDTQSQTGLTRHQRRANLRGAFRVKHPEQVSGHEILLVDDVFTTGTTASECARILRRAGAARVWVATAARTLKAEVQHAHLEPTADTDMTLAAHG